jgi:hypothetical protein
MRMVVREPIRKYLILVRIARAEHGKEAGVEIGQRIQVFRINFLDPLAILFRVSAVANADEQRNRFPLCPKKTLPERTCRVRPPARAWDQLTKRLLLRSRCSRCCGRSRIGSGAGGGGRIGGGGSGCIRSWRGGRRRSRVGRRSRSLGLAAAGTQYEYGDKCAYCEFGLHLSIPRKFNDNVLGKHVVLGFHPNVGADFRGFRLNFISLSRSWSAFNTGLTLGKRHDWESACTKRVRISFTRSTYRL